MFKKKESYSAKLFKWLKNETDEYRPFTDIGPQKIAVSKNGMIATQHPGATEAGAQILKEGGNAI